MKPRTQLEKKLQRIIERGKIRQLSHSERYWIRRHVIEAQPECKRWYAETSQTYRGLSLRLVYSITRMTNKRYFWHLVAAEAKEGANIAIAGATRSMGFFYCDTFSRNQMLSIKKSGELWEWVLQRNEVVPRNYRVRVKPKWFAFASRCVRENMYESCETYAETMYKNGYSGLYAACAEYKLNWRKYWPTIKCAMRHRLPKDTNYSCWLHYIETLNNAGRDILNPHYVCDAQFEEKYYRYVAAIERARTAEQRKQQMEEAKKYESFYLATHKQYFCLTFMRGDIVVQPIKSVQEMYEEGERMHHCVFRMGYYKKEDSLILSAKDKQGNRLETVEVDLNKMEIVQSRGLQNQPTPYHDKIVKLVSNNLNKIYQEKLIAYAKAE